MRTICFIFTIAILVLHDGIAANPADIQYRFLSFQIQPPVDYQRIEVSWPVISGYADQEIQDEINRQLFEWIVQEPREELWWFMKNPETGETRTFHIPPPTDAEDDTIRCWYDLKINSEILCSSGTVLSAAKTISIYTGGAHGRHSHEFKVFDLKTGMPLTLDDLLIDNYKETLARLTDRYVPREHLFEPDRPVPLEKSTGWYLTERGFVVHFPHYAIQAYAFGVVNVEIPWREMKPILKAEVFGRCSDTTG